MAILTVEKLGHSFGDRTLFKDVSFRLVEGDHIGLVGANGVGKSTLMSILTGQAIHDEGKVEWLPGTHYGYLDQLQKRVGEFYQCGQHHLRECKCGNSERKG